MENNGHKIKHIFIIPDGNRRWAKLNDKGFKEVYNFVALKTTPMLIKEALISQDADEITFFMMSRSNLIKRSLDGVMPILKAQEKMHYQLAEDPEIKENNIRFRIIGDKTLLPRGYLDSCEKLESINKKGKKKCNLLVAYDAEWELAKSFKDLKKLESADIVRHLILDSEVDLMIRTGFEKRISGGPLIQLKFAELFFCDFHYPDISQEKFRELIEEYYKIERRFGK